MRQWIYGVGCPLGNEEIYLRRYEQHNRDVLEYFKDRPEDFLVMDLAKGDGLQQLCTFLHVKQPQIPFPRVNTAQDRMRLKSRLIRRAKRLFKKIKKKIGVSVSF